MSIPNENLIDEQCFSVWPEALNHILEELLKTEPKSKMLETRMGDGTYKRRPLKSPDTYIGSFEIDDSEYETLMKFFNANKSSPFVYKASNGQTSLIAFASNVYQKRFTATVGLNDARPICEISIKIIRHDNAR